jgi:hypothetical protein
MIAINMSSGHARVIMLSSPLFLFHRRANVSAPVLRTIINSKNGSKRKELSGGGGPPAEGNSAGVDVGLAVVVAVDGVGVGDAVGDGEGEGVAVAMSGTTTSNVVTSSPSQTNDADTSP